MKKKLIISLIFAIPLLYYSVVSLSAPNPICHNCNVIIISIDTLGAKHLSLYNPEKIIAPYLKELASKRGVVFDSAFSQAPWTLPSHSAMLTGQYPWDIGVFLPTDALPNNIPTLSDELFKQGYAVKAFSNGPFVTPSWNFFNKDFESFSGSMAIKDWNDAKQIFTDGLSWIEEFEEKNNNPYFLFLHSFHVHDPYTTTEGNITINDIVAANTDVGEIKNVEEFIAAYEGEINQLDYEFKQFFQTLENSGRLDDTIIVFTADHGEEFDEHDTTAMHLSLYNEVTNVPLVFFIPGIEPVIKKDVVEIRSIPSTILDLATPLKEKLFTAPSLTQIINGTGRNDGYAIMVSAIQKDSTINSIEKVYENIESLDKIFSVGIRNEDYVYPLYSSVRTADWRLLQNPDGSLELYDQHQDPEEQSPVDISKGNNSEISKITESLLELIERNINNK